MMSSTRRMTSVAAATGLALVAAGCGGDGNGDGAGGTAGGGGSDGTITFWHNGTGEPLSGFWQEVADEFEEENGTSVEVTAMQNEEFDTRIPLVIQGGDMPSIWQQWGGGKMAEQVQAGALKDIGGEVQEELDSMGGSAAGWQLDGATYGLPYSIGVVGFWYNEAKFEAAGIEEPPTTMVEFLDVVQQLKDAGETPIVVGARDAWPAAHYYYYSAVRMCSPEVLEQATVDQEFSDPCWLEAGEVVQQIVEAEPFQEGFLGTTAQQGATSSAGLFANGNGAMELMGHWHPGVMSGLTEDGEGLGEDLGWFPFPSVEGGAGDPEAALGGGDGFSCSTDSPDSCVDFLKYAVSEDVQSRFGATGAGLPVVEGSIDSVEDENLRTLLEFRQSAPYVQLYLDTALGANIGGALNEAVANMFAGAAEPQDIVDAMTQAAAGN